MDPGMAAGQSVYQTLTVSYVDAQLAASDLTPHEITLVDAHRDRIQQSRQAALSQLGERPKDEATAQAWDMHYGAVDAATQEAAAREYPDTETQAAWERYLHREQLLVLRESLIQYGGDAGDPAQLGDQALQHQQYASQSQLAAAGWDHNGIAWDPSAAANQVVDVGHMEPHLDLNAPGGYEEAYAAQQAAYAAHVVEEHAAAQQQAMADPAQPMKTCRRCCTQKPVSEFYRSKANADGYDGRCKACDAIQCSERRKKKPRIENPTVDRKVCHKCSVEKSAADFYRNRTNPDGLYNNCKECFASNSQRRQAALPPIEQRMASTKVCRRCNQEKPAAEFYKNRLMLDGLYSHCKACYQAAASERTAARTGMDSKACRRCQEVKGAEEFYGSKQTVDGLQSYCKLCSAQTSQGRRSKETKEQREQQALTSPEMDQSLYQQRMQEELGAAASLELGQNAAHHGGGDQHHGGAASQPTREELEAQEAVNQEALRQQDALHVDLSDPGQLAVHDQQVHLGTTVDGVQAANMQQLLSEANLDVVH